MNKDKYPFFAENADEKEVEAMIAFAGSEEAMMMDSEWLRYESAWSTLWGRLRNNGKLSAWLLKASDDQIKALADKMPL